MTNSNITTLQEKNLNALGCIEEVKNRMTQLDAVLYSLSASADQVDENIVRAVMGASCSIVAEAQFLIERIYNQLPRTDV